MKKKLFYQKNVHRNEILLITAIKDNFRILSVH